MKPITLTILALAMLFMAVATELSDLDLGSFVWVPVICAAVFLISAIATRLKQ